MTGKQKKKRSMNIDAIIENAAKLPAKEAQAVVDYLESIKFAERKPPSSVVKTKIKGFLDGDGEKLKMLYKAPQENGLKDRAGKTEQISATQQYRAVKDMLKVPDDATVSDVIQAFAKKANCSEEKARDFIADLRNEHTSSDAYQTMMTMMKGGKKIGDSKPPEALDDSGLDVDRVISGSYKKILVEGKGDGDLSGRLSTGKMFRPNVASSAERETAVETPQDFPSEIEEIAPPGDERPTTVMPAPEIKNGEPVLEQPLEKVSLRTVDDMAQEAEPPGITRQVEAPKLDAPDKLPKDVGPLPRPDDISQEAEPPGLTQSVKAVGGDAIIEISKQAEELKEILLVKGSKMSNVKERMPNASRTVMDEGVKRYASELIQQHRMDKDQVRKKLIHKGIDPLDADAALIVMDDKGIDRSSRISQIPVSSADVVDEREAGESRVGLTAPPAIKKEDKREPTEELEAPDIEEIEPPESEDKKEEDKPEEKDEKKPEEKTDQDKKDEEKDEKKDQEKSEEVDSEEEAEEDGKIHTSDAFDPTRLSYTPTGLKEAMDAASKEAEERGIKPQPEVSHRSDISDILMEGEETEEKPEKEDSGISTGESVEIEFGAPSESTAKPPPVPKSRQIRIKNRKPPVPPASSTSRPSVPPSIGRDAEGDELAAANGDNGRISLLSPEAQEDEEITDVLVVKHAFPVSTMIGEGKTKEEILGKLKFQYELSDRQIAKAWYDGALTYVRHKLESVDEESAKAKTEDEAKTQLTKVGYSRKDIKKILREAAILSVRAKIRTQLDKPLRERIGTKTMGLIKKTGIAAAVATGVVALMGGGILLDRHVLHKTDKPEKDKQEQTEQKPEKAEDEEMVEVFMSEVPAKKDANSGEQSKDIKAPVEDKTPEEQPAKVDEPLVETQPKPDETASGPEEPEEKVTNGGKTIERPLKDEDIEPKKSATSDLEEILGGM